MLLEQGFTVGQLGYLVYAGLAKLRGSARKCAGDCDAALERLRAAKSARTRITRITAIAKSTSFNAAHLCNIARESGLSLDELAEWARANSRQISVAGKVYR